jgi:hypothetical protein
VFLETLCHGQFIFRGIFNALEHFSVVSTVHDKDLQLRYFAILPIDASLRQYLIFAVRETRKHDRF